MYGDATTWTPVRCPENAAAKPAAYSMLGVHEE
jgi:hypothetical protein